MFLALTNAYLLFCSWVKECISDTEIALEAFNKGGRGSLEEAVPCGTASGILPEHIVRDRASWMRNMSARLMSKWGRWADASEPDRRLQPPTQVAPKGECEAVFKSTRTCNVSGCTKVTRGGCRCDWRWSTGAGDVTICCGCFAQPEEHI